jgi:hypothetical protein
MEFTESFARWACSHDQASSMVFRTSLNAVFGVWPLAFRVHLMSSQAMSLRSSRKATTSLGYQNPLPPCSPGRVFNALFLLHRM